MSPTFDDFDRGILSERQVARRKFRDPQQGDLIRRKDGLYTRMTAVWDTKAQTLGYGDDGFDTLEAIARRGSFFLSRDGGMSFGGSLNPGVPLTHLRDSGRVEQAGCWFFHHDNMTAHNGVNMMVNVRIWELLDDSEAINKAIPERYIVPAEFTGSIQSATYTTFDGVERVAYNDGLTLADYMASPRGAGVTVISGAELDKLLAKHYDAMKTKPQEISEERYMDIYECLPPSRWQRRRGVNSWHCSERLTGNLVGWYFEIGDKYYTFTDDASLSEPEIEAIIGSVGGRVAA